MYFTSIITSSCGGDCHLFSGRRGHYHPGVVRDGVVATPGLASQPPLLLVQLDLLGGHHLWRRNQRQDCVSLEACR